MAEPVLNIGELQQALDALNKDTDIEWALVDSKLSKTYSFKNFIDAFSFMTRAAMHAEKLNHHPEWSNVYRTVSVNLTTHESGGITQLDFKLAKKMDSVAS